MEIIVAKHEWAKSSKCSALLGAFEINSCLQILDRDASLPLNFSIELQFTLHRSQYDKNCFDSAIFQHIFLEYERITATAMYLLGMVVLKTSVIIKLKNKISKKIMHNTF